MSSRCIILGVLVFLYTKEICANSSLNNNSDRLPEGHAVLYKKILNDKIIAPELLLNNAGRYSRLGLDVIQKRATVQLNLFYALAERMVRYRVHFSPNTIAFFKSSEGDFKAIVDLPNQTVSIETNPKVNRSVPFLKKDREYLVEIYHVYQMAKVRILDVKTGEEVVISAINNGTGGVGRGALQKGFLVGMQWDYYCFGIEGGKMLVKEVAVFALKKNVKLLIYGDSITQPEGYFPTKDFSQSWTQQLINKLGGNAMSSGRGGGRINTLENYIKNELPFIHAKYVMVTIGTNGGNTKQSLERLMHYIRSQGAVPLLNNIPANESSTQLSCNLLIDSVRKELNIKGAYLDKATSIDGTGKQVDRSTMYWEDYSETNGLQIYHHPNEKGGDRIVAQIIKDLPELFQ